MRGQSYGNAINTASLHNRLQARIKMSNHEVQFVPYLAHSLNIVDINVVSCCQNAASFFGLLKKLCFFFIFSLPENFKF